MILKLCAFCQLFLNLLHSRSLQPNLSHAQFAITDFLQLKKCTHMTALLFSPVSHGFKLVFVPPAAIISSPRQSISTPASPTLVSMTTMSASTTSSSQPRIPLSIAERPSVPFAGFRWRSVYASSLRRQACVNV